GISVAIRDVVAEFVGGAEGDPCDRASILLRDIVGKVPGVRESSESLLGSIDLTLLIRPCTAIGLPALRARPPLLVLDGHVQTAVQIGNVAAHRLDQRRPDWPVFDASGHACGNAPRELIGETVEWGRAQYGGAFLAEPRCELLASGRGGKVDVWVGGVQEDDPPESVGFPARASVPCEPRRPWVSNHDVTPSWCWRGPR